jgi:hypothetical protein
VIIGGGPKAGKSTQELILKDPGWVQFFVGKNPQSKVTAELKRHDRALTARPFVEKCRCKSFATRLSFYAGNATTSISWCDECDPYSLGARRGTLTIVRTFMEAVRFVDSTCKGRRTDKRLVVRQLAEAKGLPKRVGQSAAIAFLP